MAMASTVLLMGLLEMTSGESGISGGQRSDEVAVFSVDCVAS